MEHVPIARLLIVAINDLIFTTEEFTHLKECPECFDEWSAFVKAVETQEKL